MNLEQVTFCVADKSGLAIPLARKLAESGAKVYYHTPTDRRDQIQEGICGDGMADAEHGPIEVVEEYESILDTHPTIICPDVRYPGPNKQKFLRSLGYSVWGAADGMVLEQDRLFFLDKLKELGLDVPEYEVVTGITALREYLKGKEDIYLKCSKWRGTWNTQHWRSWDEDSHMLDVWAVLLGGLREKWEFVCCPKIDTDLEIGGDTYCIDGQWPEFMLHGVERKDQAYFSAVTPRDKMPKQLLPIMEAMSPFLKEVQYRSQWSMEVRVKEPYNYFIDATTRMGLPSTGSQILAMSNLAEVIYYGARGQLVQPEYNCKFTAECMVNVHGSENAWHTEKFDPELRPNLMLMDYCESDNQPWWPAEDNGSIQEIGWLVSSGDTPEECAREMNRLADLLPDGVDASVEALADVIRELHQEQEQGIPFTSQPLPEPEIVLEES